MNKCGEKISLFKRFALRYIKDCSSRKRNDHPISNESMRFSIVLICTIQMIVLIDGHLITGWYETYKKLTQVKNLTCYEIAEHDSIKMSNLEIRDRRSLKVYEKLHKEGTTETYVHKKCAPFNLTMNGISYECYPDMDDGCEVIIVQR